MQQMHKDMKHSIATNHEWRNIVHKTKNQFSEDDREFVFNCDQSHLVKTGRIRIKCWMI